MSNADIHFYFDPVCPFAWMISKWVRIVQAQRAYGVDWRFISLRLINATVDYDRHFPVGCEAGHTAGLRLLRVAARTRAEHGRAWIGPLYAAIGARVFDTAAEPDRADGGYRGTRTFLEPILSEARPACRTRRRAGRHLVRRRAAPRGGRGPGADRQGRRDTDHPLPAPGRRRVLRPGGQPPAQRGRGRPAVGQRHGAWPASGASPSSNAACASGRSYAASAWNPARSASRRTGTPAAGRDSGA
jgi:hypothetical protein